LIKILTFQGGLNAICHVPFNRGIEPRFY